MRFGTLVILFALNLTLSAHAKVMITSAHPHATEAGLHVLQEGGNAIDAAIAVQMVLGVVEPQCSGLGGGALLLYYRKADDKLFVYDGLESAPLSVTAAHFLDGEGHPLEKHMASLGGKAVGIPGVLKMLEMAHKEQGRALWRSLFQRAIALADVENPKLASTLLVIAHEGIKPFYEGAIAEKIVEKVNCAQLNPSNLALNDLKAYQAIAREPLRFNYRDFRIVGAPPPTSGALTVGQILGILENYPLEGYAANSLEFINLFLQASQLSFADRNTMVADPSFFHVPTGQLLDKAYLAKRAASLSKTGALKNIKPGMGANIGTKTSDLMPLEPCLSSLVAGGSHFCIVDKEGNAVAMTTSIGSVFGSKLNVEGFYLNNSLSNFCFLEEIDGKKIANRIEAGKRPLSSAAPTFVFDCTSNKLILAIGSAGGPYTIDYVAEALVNVLDFKLGLQEAISYPHYAAISEAVELEKASFMLTLMRPLKNLGHKIVRSKELLSGTQAIQIESDVLIGGTDPRRK